MEPMVAVAEAGICKYRRHKFKGLCFHKIKCIAVCKMEGFQSGHCRAFLCCPEFHVLLHYISSYLANIME
ncbi:hypothetical protein EUGRSUZ_B02619 [Eucalyptus grandis]|uniref:Uncharacterized protein n=2 Tax=Eucalyptus grandis TaxID=71139 RepID=A0ACC3LU61_EUCGR|nr:hypothetical protein EUGRSUZ_B02619 [Eucalyptus grandis]